MRAESDVDPVVAGQLAPALAGLARDPGCLVEAGEHGRAARRASAAAAGCGFSGRSASRVRSASSAGRGPWASASSRPKRLRVALPGEAGVAERLLRRVRIVLEAAAEVRDPVAERVPDVHQAGVVLRLLEQRQRLARELLELVDGRVGREEQAVVGGADAGEQLACLVAGRPRPLGGGVGDRGGLRAVPTGERLRRGRARARRRVAPAGSARAPARAARAAARSSPRQSARRPAAASRSPARSARVGSACPSSCL